MMDHDPGETPEEFWYNNLAKYQQREPTIGFPQSLSVPCLMKVSHREIAVLKGQLNNGDSLTITYPTSNHAVKNFIGIGISDCEYLADTNVQVYELDYNEPMTDEFVLSLLEDSHGWDIKDYGDLSGY
tara:strand:- start:1059 stop:1442 length:384 start_codon:yes stop_codon:yes gene_type:complete